MGRRRENVKEEKERVKKREWVRNEGVNKRTKEQLKRDKKESNGRETTSPLLQLIQFERELSAPDPYLCLNTHTCRHTDTITHTQ